jgi:hypothetical protein
MMSALTSLRSKPSLTRVVPTFSSSASIEMLPAASHCLWHLTAILRGNEYVYDGVEPQLVMEKMKGQKGHFR